MKNIRKHNIIKVKLQVIWYHLFYSMSAPRCDELANNIIRGTTMYLEDVAMSDEECMVGVYTQSYLLYFDYHCHDTHSHWLLHFKFTFLFIQSILQLVEVFLIVAEANVRERKRSSRQKIPSRIK